jgi:GGDEF domain-containing protein
MKNLTLPEALRLLSLCPTPMVLLDGRGWIRTCNPAFAALAGAPADELAGAPDDLVQPLLGDGDVVQWIMPDGSERWLAIRHLEIEAAAGQAVRFYEDVTEPLRLRRERDDLATELRASTLRDGEFISLLSRPGLLAALLPLVARSRRYNSPLSVVTLGVQSDPDSAQDMALRHMATLLRDQTRWADVIGCNEARNFILVLQETSQDAALRLVDKLTTHIERMNAGAGFRLSAQYGITECQKHDNADSLLARAEAALQEARHNESGRSIAR